MVRWRASGLSQAQFCRDEGIPEWALSTWKLNQERSEQKQQSKVRRNKRSMMAGVEFAAVGEQPMRSGPGKADAMPFVSLIPRVAESPSAGALPNKPASQIIEVIFAGSIVRIFPGADVDAIRALLQALSEYSTC